MCQGCFSIDCAITRSGTGFGSHGYDALFNAVNRLFVRSELAHRTRKSFLYVTLSHIVDAERI